MPWNDYEAASAGGVLPLVVVQPDGVADELGAVSQRRLREPHLVAAVVHLVAVGALAGERRLVQIGRLAVVDEDGRARGRGRRAGGRRLRGRAGRRGGFLYLHGVERAVRLSLVELHLVADPRDAPLSGI